MSKKRQKYLGKRQLAVIDDLFAGEITEAQVLQKHRLSAGVFRKWLGDEDFAAELAFRIESARRQSRMIIARFAPTAAAKLVELTDCKKEETRRKACLDVILVAAGTSRSDNDSTADEADQPLPEGLSPDLAGRLLAALAEEK